MAVYQFSALSDGQAISFDPNTDILNFDQPAIGAADLRVVTEGADIRINLVSGSSAGKDLVLLSAAQPQLATSNITFADGSKLLFGDNTAAQTADSSANSLTGTAGRDLLEGFGGSDTLTGGAGNDVLDGGTQFDRLVGGTGNDTFLFSVAATGANADLIVDFASGADKIALDTTIYSNAGALGDFAAGDVRFFAGAGATTGHDANDRIIYNTTNGTLWYDPDGNGSAASQLIATLQGAPALTAADITVASSSAPAGGGGGGNVINGTAGNDFLDGTPGNDTINGLGGDDFLNGRDGADSLSGADGNDTLEAGQFQQPPGDDNPFLPDGQPDTLDGGVGNDVYYVHEAQDTIVDAGGVDLVHAVKTSWTLGPGLENLFIEPMGGEYTGTGNELDNILSTDTSSLTGFSGGTVHLHGAGGNDTLDGGPGEGGISDLFGDDGNDTLITAGFEGSSMTGGAGADSFVFNRFVTGAHILDFASGTDKIHLDETQMTQLGAGGNFAAGDARFFAAAGATGGHDADDRLVYDTTANKLYYDVDGNGSQAAQLITTLQPGAPLAATDIAVDNANPNPGSTINGTAGNDSLLGTAGNDTINGLAGNDTLKGNAGDDFLDGGAGTDMLFGGTGSDFMRGGDGDDTYFVDSLNDQVIEASSGGTHDLVNAFVNGYTLPDFVNDLTLAAGITSGDGNDLDNIITGNDDGVFLRGNAGNDSMIGGARLDNLDGGAGADTMIGGGGNDGYIVDNAGDLVIEQASGGTDDSVFSFVSYVLPDSVERVQLGGFDAINATGNTLNNTVWGNDGANVLTGGAGNDTLDGFRGADTFVFDQSPGAANADLVDDFLNGSDKIQLDASVMTALGAAGNFSAGDARFYGAFGATGGHDADDRVVYDTSTGNLYYDADGSGAGVAQRIATLHASQGSSQPAFLAATDIVVSGNGGGGGTTGQHLIGTAGNDSLVGGAGDDTIEGLAGNDTLIGNAGNDSLLGGTGNDSLVGGDGDDTLEGGDGADTIDGGAGIDTQVAESSATAGSGIENLVMRGYDPETIAVDAHGNELDNRIVDEGSGTVFLYGETGNDTLIGGSGVNFFAFDNHYGKDSVDGGGGNDELLFESATSPVVVDFRNNTAGGGSDTFTDSVTFVNVERAIGGGSGDTLYAGPNGNALSGYSGDDTLIGGAGNDSFDGDSGFDHPSPNPGNDVLLGFGGNDTLGGEEGNDSIDGGAGNDQLFGGPDADIFAFSVAPGAANADQVADFVSSTDKIQLDGTVHANSGASGNFAAGDARFWSSTTGTAHDADDRVLYNTGTGELWYDSDGNGAGARQLIATLQGAPALAATDIAIVNGSGGGGGGNVINGTSGNDTLNGTDGNDTINGLAGDDVISGGEGADSLSGGDGNDTITSAVGNIGDSAADTLDGGLGNDVYNVNDDGDLILPDPGGVDTVHAINANWTLGAGLENLNLDDTLGSALTGIGNELDNVIRGSSEGGTLQGMGGNDLLIARAVSGFVSLDGGDGNDSLVGSSGNDTLDGGAGVDTMNGGDGNDTYVVTAGDVLSDSGGIDTVISNADWTLAPNVFENLTLTGTTAVSAQGNNLDNRIEGNAANNSINGRAGNDMLLGAAGNDTFDMSTGGTSTYGNDTIDGGAGTDTVDFGANARTGIHANLANGTLSGGGDAGAGSATLTSIENVIGGNFNDVLTGNASANFFYGGVGNDTLAGGAGSDRLQGGTGNDHFVFANSGGPNADLVVDFASAADKLDFDNAFFTAIGADGNFAAGDARFFAAAGATSGHDASDRVVYNSTTGNLYYDADGSGAGAAQLVATIQGHPAVTATDISVI